MSWKTYEQQPSETGALCLCDGYCSLVRFHSLRAAKKPVVEKPVKPAKSEHPPLDTPPTEHPAPRDVRELENVDKEIDSLFKGLGKNR